MTRFNRCRSAARTVTYASEDIVSNDDTGLAYAAAVAMGLAITRARHLDSMVGQLAVWDSQSYAGVPTGTEADMGLWQRAGYRTHVHPLPPPHPGEQTSATKRGGSESRVPRVVRAFLFGDVERLQQTPGGTTAGLHQRCHAPNRSRARALRRLDSVQPRNSNWGDGVFLVFRDAVAAATCALDVRTVADLDLATFSLPAGISIRMRTTAALCSK